MVKHLNTILVLILLCTTACTANSTHKSLVGQWLYSGSLNGHFAVECPDLLHLQEDGAYLVFNDCYAPTAKIPIVETGSWSFDEDNGTLFLTDRVFEVNYYFIKKAKLLTIRVQNISIDKLHLVLGDESVEVYSKIEE